MSSAIYPDPPRLVTAVCGHGEQQRLSNARLRLTFYNGPVAYCGPARPGSAFQQSAVSGLLPRARARREIPEASAKSIGTILYCSAAIGHPTIVANGHCPILRHQLSWKAPL